MKVGLDNPSHQRFIWLGASPKLRWPIQQSDEAWKRTMGIVLATSIAFTTTIAMPVSAFIIPGPIGVLAGFTIGMAAGAYLGWTIAATVNAHDTVEEPLPARVRTLLADARAPRPQPDTTTTTSIPTHLWDTPTTSHHTHIDATLWRNPPCPQCPASTD